MGVDKALLQREGTTLLEHAVQFLRDCGCDEVLVSGRPEHPAGVADVLPHCGPPGALLSLLLHLRQHDKLDGNPLLLIPVDMPLLIPRLVDKLLHNRHADCAYFAEEIFPCVVPASMRLLEHMESLFREEKTLGGDRSMRAIFRNLSGTAVAIDEGDRSFFANVNTPLQWGAINHSGDK